MARLLVLCYLMIFVAFPVKAERAGVSAELNKMEVHGNACRAYLLLINKSGTSFESLKMDLVMFDVDGVIIKRLIVQAAPMPIGKTSVKAFDMANQPCNDISRVLMNDVLECVDSSGPRKDCLGMVSTSTRSPTDFIK